MGVERERIGAQLEAPRRPGNRPGQRCPNALTQDQRERGRASGARRSGLHSHTLGLASRFAAHRGARQLPRLPPSARSIP